MSTFFRIPQRPGNAWRDRLAEIKAARDEYKSIESIAGPGERVLFSKSINEKIAEVENMIIQGALSEFQSAVDQWHDANKKLQTAKNDEVKRWSAEKINAEMTMAESLVKNAVRSSTGGQLEPDVLPRLRSMYQEAYNSGDLYKQRAYAEVFTGLAGMVGNDGEARLLANRLSKQARRDARAVRVTPELEKADQAAAAAVEGINKAKSTLFEVDDSMGWTKFNGEIGNFQLYTELQRIKTGGNNEIVDIVPTDQVYRDGA